MIRYVNHTNFKTLLRSLLGFALIMCLVIFLAACGRDSSAAQANTNTSSTTSSAPTAAPTTGSTPTATSQATSTGNDYGGGGYGGKYGSSTGTATTTPAAKGSSAVQIVDNSSGFGFSPESLTVAVGTTVVWTSASSAPHTVTSNTGAFDSGISHPLEQGQTFSFQFKQAGTYTYHCQIHPSMIATIIVH
jgi:plastocyanin